jgi:hypothetical protein
MDILLIVKMMGKREWLYAQRVILGPRNDRRNRLVVWNNVA